MALRSFNWPLLALTLAACGEPNDDARDAAPVDAAPVDAALADAAPVDAAPQDAQSVDASPVDAAPVDAATPVAFTQAEVNALLTARCMNCHVGVAPLGGFAMDPADFTRSTHDVPSLQLPRLDRIEPGDRTRSYLYLKITGEHLAAGGFGERMPNAVEPLSAAEIEGIGLYIDALTPTPPREACQGALDEDGDGLADCLDPDCADAPLCVIEDCGNASDDDADMLIDCDDPDCVGALACTPEDCANGADDDGDNVADCGDADCVALPVCNPELCDDTADNDADGATDCDDDDCLGVGRCAAPMDEEEVQRLFNSRCAGCHIGRDLGGLRLDAPFTQTTVAVPSRASALRRIEPGNRQASFLWHKVNGSQANVGGGGRMPQNGMLTRIQVERLGGYIDALPPSPVVELCANFADDDGDALVDCGDPDCTLEPACQPEVCGDVIDNDGDFLIDCADADCAGVMGCGLVEVCDNGRDDDGDALADCADDACAAFAGCQLERCDNGVDDNRDTLVDCVDPQCIDAPACAFETCDNGRDDDNNGQADCADMACANDPACIEDCRDGVDNNGNALIDCLDPSCARAVPCQVEDCGDRIDNNANGLVDCNDPQCAGLGACGQENCGNGVDDNGDRRVDCFDPQCELTPACVQPFTTDDLSLLFSRGCGCHSNAFLRAPFTNGTVNVPSVRGAGLDLIEPGNPARSFLYLKIAGTQAVGAGNRMPQGGPYWSDLDTARFAAWITALAP